MTAPRLTGADQSEYFGSAVVLDTSTTKAITTRQPIPRVMDVRDFSIALLLQLLFEPCFTADVASAERMAGRALLTARRIYPNGSGSRTSNSEFELQNSGFEVPDPDPSTSRHRP